KLFKRTEDLYELLGVSKDSSINEIKKAYYQKYHPDTNKEKDAQEKFIKIQNAYERAQYDQFGVAGDGMNDSSGGAGFYQQHHNMSMDDIFNTIFGNTGGNPFGDIFGDQPTHIPSDVVVSIPVTFMEWVTGAKKTITFSRNVRCSDCDGKGYPLGSKASRCSDCDGTGMRRFRGGRGIDATVTCMKCRGSGRSHRDTCRTCAGEGVKQVKETLNIKIPRGVGNAMKMSGKGNEANDRRYRAGNLIIQLNVQPSSVFKRVDDDIYVDVQIPFITAILGGSVRVPTIAGDVDLKIPAGTQPEERKRLRNRGISNEMTGNVGHEYVTFKVTLPT
ncbi:hypothetical protein ROZALSC1DRAFT_26660, partial [Rozella allomycis CSF55]